MGAAPLALAVLLPLASAQYGWRPEDELNTIEDPWTPCEKTYGKTTVRAFCRLSCTARWSYAPERMNCRMLPLEALLSRSHSRGLERFQQLSQDSFSKVNSGVSDQGSNDPDV